LNRVSLPIDEHLAAVTSMPAEGAVIVAPPGTGKSTRVPPALARAGRGPVWVLQPRRLAARMLATRVAEEWGSQLGQEVGYEVRFDRKVSRHTQVVFMTAGLFLRKLVADPHLTQVGCVVIDEFHERQLDCDLALSLSRDLRERRALDIVVMSATMDPGPVAEFLGGARIVETEVRTFPVDVLYRPGDRAWRLEQKVAAAVKEIGSRNDGNILVFLPGKREIERAQDAVAGFAASAGLAVAPLHGQLPAAEQDRAVKSRDRRIVLATNVAETSVTVDDVIGVVDSGLARVARYSPWTAVPTLSVEPVSVASADQRAGRAGRTRPGTCIRLYDKGDLASRPAATPPEVARADLAAALLMLHGLEGAAPTWFESPPEAALVAARALLERLGLVANGAITDVGRAAMRLPVHPRLARIIEVGERLGVGASACGIAAIIEAGPVIAAVGQTSSDSDVVDELELLECNRRRAPRELRSAGLDPRAASEVDRIWRQLVDLAGARDDRTIDIDARAEHLRYAVCAGFLDRVCRRRRSGSDELALFGVARASLGSGSAVRDAELMVAVDATELGAAGGRRLEVRRASAIRLEWLIDLDAEGFEDIDVHEVGPGGRVERVRRMIFGGLVVDEERSSEPSALEPAAAAAALLAELPLPRWRACTDVAAVDRLRTRLALIGAPEAVDDDALDAAFAAACVGVRTRAEVRAVALASSFLYGLDSELRARLDRDAPETIRLPGRQRVVVHYEAERDPWVESRLQDFIGLAELPEVAGAPVVAHLLAPNGRAVQVTRDLARFWTEHYPALRKQLMRRYPRHAWPEDPSGSSR